MAIIQRNFIHQDDLRSMTALSSHFFADNIHVVALPYRFSSWALDDPDNVSLWFDAEQNLVAWAALQTPFWAIDYAYDSRLNSELHRRILSWADERARNVLGGIYGHPAWFIDVFEHQINRSVALEAMGFVCQAEVEVEPWSKVLMARSARDPTLDAPLPDGFSIRPLNGESEISTYVALHRAAFNSTNMTEEWRTRVLQHPAYQPHLDLVVEAPDGALAAFCVFWLNDEYGQVEPLGVGEVYRGLGLGKAMLAEGFRRLHALGAKKIYVETDDYRDAAFNLYSLMGFRVQEKVLVYRKDYE